MNLSDLTIIALALIAADVVKTVLRTVFGGANE